MQNGGDKRYRVAILGATGLVGQQFISILAERRFPISELKLLASDRSAGGKISFNGTEITVEEATAHSFEGIDIALFSAGSDVSRHFAPIAVKQGAVVVDNSAAFRMDPRVPLVVPEINPEDIAKHNGIIANPNCSTIQMVVALFPLHKVNPIKRIIVSTYQSVSGTGKAALTELEDQSRLALEQKEITPHVYPHQIAFNILPEIDVFLDNDYTKEEWKMVEETRKIMHAPDIAISATCARVPVFYSHSESVNVEFTEPVSPDGARRILAGAPGVKILDEPGVSLYPLPASATGSDNVYVGRIRQDVSTTNGLVMWVVADNIRKGAALNAVQIAETMVREGWLQRDKEEGR
ncbi:MAG: aspartate-semialdehyde dehydrogenase [Dehalococcoidales bacterium]|nr:aspartate-semialdehyde dehydrogenase [Dehalococcoidales bacterium]